MSNIVNNLKNLMKETKCTPARFGEYLLDKGEGFSEEFGRFKDDKKDWNFDDIDEEELKYNPLVHLHKMLADGFKEQFGEAKLVNISPSKNGNSDWNSYYDVVVEFSKQDGLVMFVFEHCVELGITSTLNNTVVEVKREVYVGESDSKVEYKKVGDTQRLR